MDDDGWLKLEDPGLSIVSPKQPTRVLSFAHTGLKTPSDVLACGPGFSGMFPMGGRMRSRIFMMIALKSLLMGLFLHPIQALGENQPQEKIETQEDEKPKALQNRIKLDLTTPELESVVLLGNPIRIDLGKTICKAPETKGLSVDKENSVLQIDPIQFAPQWMTVGVAQDQKGCGQEAKEVRLFPTGLSEWSVSQRSMTLWFDSKVAELTGTGLDVFQLVAVVDGVVQGVSACVQSTVCTLSVDPTTLSALASESVNASILVWPKEIPLDTGKPFPRVVSLSKTIHDWRAYAAQIDDVVFAKPLILEPRLEPLEEHQLVVSRCVKAIHKVSCNKAECRLTDQGILVFHVDLAASSVKLRYTLKPGYQRKLGSRMLSTETISLKLERCSIRVPKEVPLLAGVENHRFFIKLPRECTSIDPSDLLIKTRPPTRVFVRSEIQTADEKFRLFQVSFERVPRGADSLNISVFEQTGFLRRLGSTKIPVLSSYAPLQLRLEVPGIGVVEHLPTNVWAELVFGTNQPTWHQNYSVEERSGFYRVAHSEKGWSVMAEPGVTGSVPLRFAYRPKRLVSFVGGTETSSKFFGLATFDTEVFYPVRTINVAISLLGDGDSFFQVLCGVRGKETEIEVGSLARIPYEERDSCRIVFDREKVPVSAGVQRLRVQAGGFNQILLLGNGRGTLTVAIPVGDKQEYDKLTAVISHDMLSGHYTFQSRQSLGGEARYRILLSDSWWRIGATTAMPTGLFRFGAGDSEGSIPLSAGVLTRLNYIQRNGRDFPLGFEAGLFGTNLSGRPDFSMILGVGLSIPVLNTNTSLQASFNIHAWLEYAPTRVSGDDSPVAFLFGPSFSVGRLSTTF